MPLFPGLLFIVYFPLAWALGGRKSAPSGVSRLNRWGLKLNFVGAILMVWLMPAIILVAVLTGQIRFKS